MDLGLGAWNRLGLEAWNRGEGFRLCGWVGVRIRVSDFVAGLGLGPPPRRLLCRRYKPTKNELKGLMAM